jgi:hypothetical protein
MIWEERSSEESALLNPGFCANLLWHAARGYERESTNAGLSFEESFLVLPFVLHRATRESLPRSTRTSLAVWLDEYPLTRGRLTNRARSLVSYTKEALLFGGIHGFIRIEHGKIFSDVNWRLAVKKSLKTSSDEVSECVNRAEFVGKWFASTGGVSTVLALIGVRP